MKNKRKPKFTKTKVLGSRTVIGIICLAVALVTCFGVAPVVNNISDGKSEIVRIVNPVVCGNQIREEDIEIVKVGSHNLPQEVIAKKQDVVGKFATVDLYKGDYLLPQKLASEVNGAQNILSALDGGQKAISITIGSFASGVSGKLETGDIISIITYSSKDGIVNTPPELQYVKVITSTTSGGVDKADVTDTSQPVTVTLLVNQEQAELLAKYEKTVSMHFTLEYRGDASVAQRYLDEQNRYFAERGE